MNIEAPQKYDDNRESERVPFDIRTLLLGVWKCRWTLAIWAVFSVAFAVFIALTVAPQIWRAEVVMLYQPPSDELLAGMYEPPSIHTQLNMVKVKPNLAETRMRLKLQCTLDELGAACELRTPRDSQLLVCAVEWDSPDQVTNIANTLTDVFMQRQERLRRMELTGVIREMESRLVLLRNKLEKSGRVQSEEDEQRERLLESCRNRINTADEMYEKAITELKATERQLKDLKAMEASLRQELLNDESGKGETISSLNTRTERIRERILDKRQQDINALTIRQWKERMAFNERMLSHGFISDAAFSHERAEYQKHLRESQDSEEVKQLKGELDRIYEQMRPDSVAGVDASPLMQALAIQGYQLRLQWGAAVERVAQLQRSQKRLQAEYREASRKPSGVTEQPPHLIESWLAESRQLEEALAKVRAVADSNTSGFEYVSHATRPSHPSKSYRKLTCLAAGALCMMIGVMGVVIAQLVNPTVRSGADARIKLNRDEVVVLPILSDGTQSLLDEQVRALAERVRWHAEGQGARVLISSTRDGEGRTMLAGQLASCVARRGETVIVLDASVRTASTDAPGLTDFLVGDSVTLAETLVPGVVPGVFHIGRGRAAIVPDLLASHRMKQLLNELSEQFDLVIIDGPAGYEHADADVLARLSDGVLMVVKANGVPGREVRRLSDRLESAGAPLLSVVLNQTDATYLSHSI